MTNTKVCITFAGPVGSSKSPIAYYLSHNLNLPIFNNDTIRTEVTEDYLEFNETEFRKRASERVEEILKKGFSFIYDASVDREWPNVQEYLIKYNYHWFIISLDTSKDFLTKLYIAKGYEETLKKIDELFKDHENFLLKYSNQVSLSIDNKNFQTRLQDSLQQVESFLNDIKR